MAYKIDLERRHGRTCSICEDDIREGQAILCCDCGSILCRHCVEYDNASGSQPFCPACDPDNNADEEPHACNCCQADIPEGEEHECFFCLGDLCEECVQVNEEGESHCPGCTNEMED